MVRPHVLVIPFPAQGHVMPLMELSRNLVKHGFKITFVNSEFTHKRVMATLSENENSSEDPICLVSIPDGMKPGEDRNQLGKLRDAMAKVVPGCLEELIKKINGSSDDDRIACLIADVTLGCWALEVAQRLLIPRAAFWPASCFVLADLLHLPKLVQDGVFATDGTLEKTGTLQLLPTMPATHPADFLWLSMGDLATQQSWFNLVMTFSRTLQLSEYLICNSFYELELSAFAMIPSLRPIGPLNASSRLAQFWPEDSTCLSWLDEQTPRSVIYVAFGSFTILEKQQFDELALGLELSRQPFLWVVRHNLTGEGADVYPDGFEERVGSRGHMVCWAPQREVLAHPSIACFITHCGWNSTMEGISLGVPFLCWPYFADQNSNKRYICDFWKVGLGFRADENGIISREEIKAKVVQLLEDDNIKDRSLYLKQIAAANVTKGGASSNNFDHFVQWIKK